MMDSNSPDWHHANDASRENQMTNRALGELTSEEYEGTASYVHAARSLNLGLRRPCAPGQKDTTLIPRKYQIQAVYWMQRWEKLIGGGIIMDAMGLGKI